MYIGLHKAAILLLSLTSLKLAKHMEPAKSFLV